MSPPISKEQRELSVVYYFGCEPTQPGHRLWRAEWRQTHVHDNQVPHNLLRGLDGTFVPEHRDGPGWQSSRVGPWWIVSRIDNTVDSRPGSHSTFVGRGFADEGEFLAAARKRFPSVFARLEGLRA